MCFAEIARTAGKIAYANQPFHQTNSRTMPEVLAIVRVRSRVVCRGWFTGRHCAARGEASLGYPWRSEHRRCRCRRCDSRSALRCSLWPWGRLMVWRSGVQVLSRYRGVRTNGSGSGTEDGRLAASGIRPSKTRRHVGIVSRHATLNQPEAAEGGLRARSPTVPFRWSPFAARSRCTRGTG